MARFADVEFDDTFFVYGSCDGKSRAARGECQCWYPATKHTSKLVSATQHASQKENMCTHTTSTC